MSRAYISRKRFYVMAALLLFCFSVLVSKLFYLHVLDHSRLSRIVESNRSKHQVLPARRGNIIDAKGNILATTQQVYVLGVDPQVIDAEKDSENIVQLARLLDVDLEYVYKQSEKKTYKYEGSNGTEIRKVRWKKLAADVDEKTYRKIKELKIKGVTYDQTYKREYPSGDMAAHMLGFINKENVAVTGVEKYMNFYLTGQNGWRESERDGRRRELVQFRSREVQPISGLNVELCIDQMVQHIVEEQVKKIAKKYDPISATIIVSEPSTGDLLALSNYPAFDPNTFWKSDVDTHKNRAITDVIEPGSTFKIVPAAAALNEGLLRPEDIIDCGIERVQYKGREIPLPGDHHNYGRLSVRDVIVKSSNRGAAHMGMLLGEHKLYDYSRAFGFGEKSGFDMPGESIGRLLPVNRWDWLTIRTLPMGHAMSATPMQIHYAMSVIANGGILVEPRLIKRVFDDEGETVVGFNPTSRRRAVSTATANTMAKILSGVVKKGGTATRAELKGFEVAGKTGTTKKLIKNEYTGKFEYSSKHHVASFVGFFPASDPKLVISVIVDDPKTKGPAYGGLVAAPVFHDIGEQLIRYLGIQPVKGSKGTLAMKGESFDWLR